MDFMQFMEPWFRQERDTRHLAAILTIHVPLVCGGTMTFIVNQTDGTYTVKGGPTKTEQTNPLQLAKDDD